MDIMTIISNAAGELIAPTTAAYVLAAIGLNIHFGMTGLMNMGQAGFMLLGAYGFAVTQSMGCNLFASVCAALAINGMDAELTAHVRLRMRGARSCRHLRTAAWHSDVEARP